MILAFQIISVIICLADIWVLLRTRQSKPVTLLILCLISCFFMNVGYLLLIQAGVSGAAGMALNIQYLGNAMFYFFFLLFVLSFLDIKRHKWDKFLVNTWLLMEGVGMVLLWGGNYKNLVFSHLDYNWNQNGLALPGIGDGAESGEHVVDFHKITGVNMRIGPVYMIRYSIICLVLAICILLTIMKFISTKVAYERRNLMVIMTSVCLMGVSVAYMLIWRPTVDTSPSVAALVLLIISFSINKGNFFQATDIGREKFVNETDNIFIMTDPQYGFLGCNEKAMTLFPELRELKQGKKVSDEVKNIFTGDKESIWIDDFGYKISKQELWEHQILLGYSMMLTDITELQEAMDKANQATEAKSAFLSNMSHEIRTPMNAIVGIAEIMLRDEHNDRDQEYLATIMSSGQSLLSIINDILDYSKIESGKLQVIDYEYEVYSTLNDLNMIFANRVGNKDVKLVYDIDWHIPAKLYGDGNRIRQVVINIVNNAIKFTDHGSVTVSIKSERLPEDKIRLFFKVKDTGIGIKPEDMPKLFNSFEQVDTKKNRSKEGTGLGLAISKQLVELMGGTIGISSVYGEGTEMSFDVVQGIRSSEVIGDLRNTVLSKPKEDYIHFKAPDAKVLIVDDNAINLKVATGLLAPLSMQITMAGSGYEALDKVQEEKFDLIFMDHMMPGMDGVETTAKIRDLNDYYKELPIVALTANATNGVKEELKAAGMNDYVSKPISMRRITKVLAKWLPEGYVHYEDGETPVEEEAVQESDFTKALRTVPGLNVDEALINTGSEKLLEELVEDWCKIAELKKSRILEHLRTMSFKDFTVEVHDVKGTSRVIGAIDVSEKFKELEMLGREADMLKIQMRLKDALTSYTDLRDAIRAAVPYDEEADENLSEDVGYITMLLQGMKEAAESFDIDSMDDIVKKLRHTVVVNRAGIFEKLEAYVANLEMDNIFTVADEILTKLEDDKHE